MYAVYHICLPQSEEYRKLFGLLRIAGLLTWNPAGRTSLPAVPNERFDSGLNSVPNSSELRHDFFFGAGCFGRVVETLMPFDHLWI